MPPKKKGKGKGKKGKKGGKGDKDDGATDGGKVGTPEPSEKELLLQQELEKVTADLQSAKKRVEDLRKENEWLQQEGSRVRVESHEYMGYMEKKTTKRKTTIITLSDHNKEEIRNIDFQKQNMEEEFNQKKQALQNLLFEKQNILKKTTEELSELQEYKDLQTDQLDKIKELEKEVMVMRSKHSDTIQQLKSTFLAEKREYQQDSESRITALEKLANKEASQCLSDHTNRIKLENRRLRRELQELIHMTRVYQAHQRDLEEQRKQLLREQQYADDLKKLRSTRQHKVLKAFDMLDNGEGDVAEEAGR
ncbi:coiled-coil domain-containing protein 166-like [Crassostrea angulata]|uniref:coiled-coil domain-containing protein 166-like n=1 Tax=Magallana angulata TaxID=2784310 RepID=UPI0022B18474|nr:coiled-coil domain-containing protein 166-like [Crassostrea angulata]